MLSLIKPLHNMQGLFSSEVLLAASLLFHKEVVDRFSYELP